MEHASSRQHGIAFRLLLPQTPPSYRSVLSCGLASGFAWALTLILSVNDCVRPSAFFTVYATWSVPVNLGLAW